MAVPRDAGWSRQNLIGIDRLLVTGRLEVDKQPEGRGYVPEGGTRTADGPVAVAPEEDAALDADQDDPGAEALVVAAGDER